jgi:hypothetical protein
MRENKCTFATCFENPMGKSQPKEWLWKELTVNRKVEKTVRPAS